MSHVRDNIRHYSLIVLHPINPHHQFQPKVMSYFTSYKQHIIFYYNIPINIFIISMAGHFSLFKSCTTHLMSITTADQMRLYPCIIWLQSLHRVVCIFDRHDCVACIFLHCFAYSATTSLHRIDRDHVSSSHRPRPRLHRIDRDHVFIASTATTSSSHRPRLHRIDRDHVSSSHRPRPRLHRIDRDHVFIAATATTSSSQRPRLHRIDHDLVFIASTAMTECLFSFSHLMQLWPMFDSTTTLKHLPVSLDIAITTPWCLIRPWRCHVPWQTRLWNTHLHGQPLAGWLSSSPCGYNNRFLSAGMRITMCAPSIIPTTPGNLALGLYGGYVGLLMLIVRSVYLGFWYCYSSPTWLLVCLLFVWDFWASVWGWGSNTSIGCGSKLLRWLDAG